MLTPQDIQEKTFGKAVFGGYDMAAVDAFLEELGEDYAALHKENVTLKANLRALLEKVKEYRATEDAMRNTLLTAQKISDKQVADAQAQSIEIVEKAKKEADAILAEADRQFDIRKSEFGRRTLQEVEGVRQARAATAEYLNSSRQLLARQAELLARLERLNRQPEPVKVDVAPSALDFSLDDEPVKEAAPAPAPAPAAEPAPVPQETPAAEPAVKAPEKVEAPATEGTKVFDAQFRSAVRDSVDNTQFSLDDLDIDLFDK